MPAHRSRSRSPFIPLLRARSPDNDTSDYDGYSVGSFDTVSSDLIDHDAIGIRNVADFDDIMIGANYTDGAPPPAKPVRPIVLPNHRLNPQRVAMRFVGTVLLPHMARAAFSETAGEDILSSSGLRFLTNSKLMVFLPEGLPVIPENIPRSSLVAMAVGAQGCNVNFGKYMVSAADDVHKRRWSKMIICAEILKEPDARTVFSHWGWIVSAYILRLYDQPPHGVVNALRARSDTDSFPLHN